MRSKADSLYHFVRRFFYRSDDSSHIDYKRSSDFEMKNIQGYFDQYFDSVETANQPYEMVDSKNKKVALLIHGLSDSPYYMKDIARHLFQDGYNIVALSLSGHSTTAESLSCVELADWIEDLRYGINHALKYAPKVTLVGMSTGGSLALEALLDPKVSGQISSAILISPALKLIKKAEFLCFNIMKGGFQGWKKHGEGVRYHKIANEAICALCRLNQKIQQSLKSSKTDLPSVAVFFASNDQTVDVKRSSEILGHLKCELTEFLMGGDMKLHSQILPDSLHLYPNEIFGHISVLLEEQGFAGEHEVNPNFSIFYNNLRDFLLSSN